MIENIVRRAKKLSIKRQIEGGGKGISTQDLLDSIRQEFREHEDLPNTTNPDDWAKISGRRASASCSCARSSPRARKPTAAVRSSGCRPASTSSEVRPALSAPV